MATINITKALDPDLTGIYNPSYIQFTITTGTVPSVVVNSITFAPAKISTGGGLDTYVMDFQDIFKYVMPLPPYSVNEPALLSMPITVSVTAPASTTKTTSRDFMLKVIITSGIPASGKSTWAKTLLKLEPLRWKRINRDSLRLMLDDNPGGNFEKSMEAFVNKTRMVLLESALRNGFNVVIDDTNIPLGGKTYQEVCAVAALVGDVRVIEKSFPIPLEEALLRNKNADRNPVPDQVIIDLYNKANRQKMSEHEEYFPPIVPVNHDVSLEDCYVFDIDGTLAHMHNRSPYDLKRVGEDKVDENLLRLLNHLKEKAKIIILSGRDGSCRDLTQKWLSDNGIEYSALYMRAAGDMRADTIIKQELYIRNLKGKFNIIQIFDDRNGVVAMWRRIGLKVCQVNYGDF